MGDAMRSNQERSRSEVERSVSVAKKPARAQPAPKAVHPKPSPPPAANDEFDFAIEGEPGPSGTEVNTPTDRSQRGTNNAPILDDDSAAAPAPAAEARAKKSASPKALFEELQNLKLATADCPSARDRTKAICDLASQICGLMDRDPDVASTVEYCHNAKARCSDAARRTTERCGE
jgi:hypothetical protein